MSEKSVVWNKGKKRPAFSKEWRENLSIAGKNRKVPQGVIDACILRNKTNNPMWNLKTIEKAVAKRNYKEIAYKTTQTKIKNGTFLEYSKRMKENNPMKDPEINKKVNQNPEVIRKRIKSLIKKPNKKEKILMDLIKKYKFPYVYVGDGEKIIGVKNPDFIMLNGKKIIELFGDYWHTKKVRCFEETEKGRIEYFKKYGYKTLVIWEHELNNPALMADKIKNF